MGEAETEPETAQKAQEDQEEAQEGQEAQTPEPEADLEATKSRALRRRVLFTLAPLIPALFIPWPDGFAWEMNDRFDTSAFVAIPVIAFLATLLGTIKKPSLLVRQTVIGLLGLALVWSLHDLASGPRFIQELARGLRRLDAHAFYLVPAVPSLVITLELTAALDRSSRFRSALSAFGWWTLAASFFVPLRSDRVESMLFLVMTEAIDDASRRPEEFFLVALPIGVLLLVSLTLGLYALLRMIPKAPKDRAWRPRSGCFAFGFVIPPALLILLFFIALSVDENEPILLGVAWSASAWFLALLAGLPVMLAAGLDALFAFGTRATGKGEPAQVKRARLGFGALGLVSVGSCLVPLAGAILPDTRESSGAEELHSIAEVIVAASMGEDTGTRFLGGYSDFDLRGSRGELRDALGDADANLVYAVFDMTIDSPGFGGRVELGVDAEGALQYLGGSRGLDDYPGAGQLRSASEPLSDLADRIAERLSPFSCPTAVAPPPLPGLTDRSSTFPALCEGGGVREERRRIRDIPYSGSTNAKTGRYRVWVRSGAEVRRLEGILHSAGGRLWIGRTTLAEP